MSSAESNVTQFPVSLICSQHHNLLANKLDKEAIRLSENSLQNLMSVEFWLIWPVQVIVIHKIKWQPVATGMMQNIFAAAYCAFAQKQPGAKLMELVLDVYKLFHRHFKITNLHALISL